jgi:hypothetical protein
MAIAQSPFTKIVEEVMLEVRENSQEPSVERKYWRRVNDIYVRDLTIRAEFDFMRKKGSVTLPAIYDTGTVSVTSGGTSVTGSGTTWTSSMTGWKIRFNDNFDLYDFTYLTATTGTISPAYTGDTDLSGGGYQIFQDTLNLASDYDRIVDPPGFYYDYSRGRVCIKSRQIHKDWYRNWTSTRALYPEYYRLIGLDSDNLYWRIQFNPPVSEARLIRYEYIPHFEDMTEYTSGTCATTAGTTTVTGTGTDFTNNVAPGDAFRMEATPNDWYLISSVDSATQVSLTSNFPTTRATAAYTISKVPKTPIHLHLAIFYGACYLSSQDQDNDTATKNYFNLYRQTVSEYMAIENRIKFGKQKVSVKDNYRRFERD